MLDILRKHASSWVIKVLLGAIVLSFMFFFGYSSMRDSSGNRGGDAVASVNGRPISLSEYKFVLDNNFERMQATFKGQQVPDFVQKMAQSQTLRQLVTRELGLEMAGKLSVVVPDIELAEAIKKSPYSQRDGQFDPIFYRRQFLPYFKQRFGLDYEKFLRQDLKLALLESIFVSVDKGVPTAKDIGENDVAYSWTFESITLDPAKLVEEGKATSAEEVRSAAELLINSEPNKWKGLAAPLDAKVERTGPITVKDRKRLLEGQGTVEDMTEIFSMSTEKPMISKPIERGGKFYVIRLVERKESKADDNVWPARDFFRSWMAKFSENAKVVSYLNEEE